MKEVLETLAKTYEQLYVKPGEEAGEIYADIVKCGQEAPVKTLDHFVTSEKDILEYLETPVGKVCAVTLYERRDFVTFMQIMANRCAPVPVPDTQGAAILSGIINWRKIEAHRDEFIASEKAKGVSDPDWSGEFKRFTSDKSNYLDTLIVLSVGPYSGVPGEKFGYEKDEWIRLSDTIRKYHECTHFICRKKYPELKDAVWDELVADAVGIYAALGHFDSGMEEVFLGVKDGCYVGGRLENYVEDTELNSLAAKVAAVLKGFEELIRDMEGAAPFEIAIALEESKDKNV